ncbi:MAG: FAD-binding oxidoreductase [Chloroflexi bacterium]|nr:FAD-binding oxidoreductase [Chloroflexota bacterium]
MISPSLLEALARDVGRENVVLEEPSLEAYSIDAFGRYRGAFPAEGAGRVYAAVRPSSIQEVAEIVRLATEHRVPLVPFGGGTGVMGAITPLRGGIAVDLKRMNRVIAISPEDRAATVQAGIVLADLDSALHQKGLMLGHDPYSVPIATVGGAISTNGVGYRAARYGSMGEQVLGLTVVMPNGEILQTRAVPKTSAGPSLHHLFIGAEGALGIITQATLRVFPLPEARVFKTIAFPDFESGFHAMVEMFSLGLRPALVDLTEEEQDTPSGNVADAAHPHKIQMYLVFEGYTEEVEAQVSRTRKVCTAAGGEDIGARPARDYWDTRHDSAYSYKERFLDQPPGMRPQRTWPRTVDYPHVALPASKVLEYRRRCKEIASGRGIWIREYSSWTEPELFSMILVDVGLEGNGQEGDLAQASNEVLALAQDMGGSMEYVHGVGTKLAHLMPRELGHGMEVLRAIKAALDPHNIMNPGRLGL